MSGSEQDGDLEAEPSEDLLSLVDGQLREGGWESSTHAVEDSVSLVLASRGDESALVMVVTADTGAVRKKHVSFLVRKGLEREVQSLAVVSRLEYTVSAVETAQHRGVALLDGDSLGTGGPFEGRDDGLQGRSVVEPGGADEGGRSAGTASSPTPGGTGGSESGPSRGMTARSGTDGAGRSDPTDPPAGDGDDVGTGGPANATDDESGVDTDLDNALRYPMNEPEWYKTIAVGTVVEYLSVLILPLFVLQGYYVRVMHRTMDGDPEPPTFENPAELVVDGFKASTLLAVYYAVPVLVFAGFVLGSLDAMRRPTVSGVTGLIYGSLVSLVVFAVFSYVAAAGVVRFADTGRLSAGFGTEVFSVLFNGAWFVMWLKVGAIGFVAGVVLALVGGVLSLIPVVGWLLAAVLGPAKVKYLGTVYARLVAKTYRRIDDGSSGDATPAASQ